MIITWANRITLFRILCIPVYILLLLYYIASVKANNPDDSYRYIAICFFLGISFLDGLDGFLARKLNQITKLGAVLDPLADKSLMVSSFIILSSSVIGHSHPNLPTWFVLLVISRDILLVAGALVINIVAQAIQVQSRIWGKIASFLQALVVALVLLKIEGPIFQVGIVLAALFTLISGIQYCISGYHQLENS